MARTNMQKKYVLFLVVLSMSYAVTQNCVAQYVWLNEKGGKQYSDMPPPKNTPKERILKAPGGVNRIIVESNNTDSDNTKNSAPKSEIEKLQKPQTAINKNEDFNKRKIAKEEAEKKAETERQAAADKEKNCARAKSYQQTIESGMIITSRDQNGERIILDETQRAKELADVKKVTGDCK